MTFEQLQNLQNDVNVTRQEIQQSSFTSHAKLDNVQQSVSTLDERLRIVQTQLGDVALNQHISVQMEKEVSINIATIKQNHATSQFVVDLNQQDNRTPTLEEQESQKERDEQLRMFSEKATELANNTKAGKVNVNLAQRQDIAVQQMIVNSSLDTNQASVTSMMATNFFSSVNTSSDGKKKTNSNPT
jgi:hypothetical protein